jgi:phage gp16-like protein
MMDRKTRNQQLARIHILKAELGMDDDRYRDFLEGLTGKRSCGDMSDAQVNHVLDWMMYLAGKRAKPRQLSGQGEALSKGHLLAKAEALARQAPPDGWSVNPIRSSKFMARVVGRPVAFLETLTAAELVKLIEATKSVYRRAAEKEQKASGIRH